MADIRSFFTGGKKTNDVTHKWITKSAKVDSTKEKETQKEGKSKKAKEKKRRVIIESDSDEEPLPSKLRKNKKEVADKKKKSNKKVSDTKKKAVDDSDEDEVTSTSPHQPPPIRKPDHKKKALTPKKEVLKPTTAADYFGNAKSDIKTSLPSKRKKIDTPEKRVEKEENKQPLKQIPEFSLVDNDDFNLDEIDKSIDVSPSKKVKKRPNIDEIDKSIDVPLSKKQKKSETAAIGLSPEKVSKFAAELSEDVITPTPPVKKPAKNISLAKKPKITKANENKQNESDTERNSIEKKMKDSVSNYIEQGKEMEKKRIQQKNENLETHVMKEDNSQSYTPITPSTGTTPVEKKKSYWAYKNRDGPTALGTKELPVGAENCLEGLTFVITGVLESFQREVIVDCVNRYGGKVTGNVSGRTSYVIVGRDAGQSKIDKAIKHKTKQLTEDEFLELVKTRPAKHSTTTVTETSKRVKSSKSFAKQLNCESPVVISDSQSSSSQSISDKKRIHSDNPSSSSQSTPIMLKNLTQLSNVSAPSQSITSPAVSSEYVSRDRNDSLLWVDKYKPRTIKNIVGQQGDKSNVNKLKKWLIDWKFNNSAGKPKTNFYAGKEDGSVFKAALLSGPPGVGKTTTATLVCQEVGFSFIEMNASDTRGKKALDTVIKESLSNITVKGILQDANNNGSNHVLIMDEVDGMAGTEDRGGMQELIQLIKKSKIPIICMCNDRNHPKVRSLANYCFDLRFYKPRVEQIKGFALSIAAREDLTIPPQAMEQIVVGANQDIRQVVHNLQMWTATTDTLTYDEAKENASNASKNIKLGPFDIVKQLFTDSDASKMSIREKSDLFFMDYSFVPLFIQENYLSVKPALAKGSMQKTLELISSTADSIVDGNLIERLIQGEQNWSLLPLQGLLSTVIPSMKMAGYLGQRIEFPQWLGKNSSRGKYDRILQELKTHMSLSCDCAKANINLEYISTLKRRLTQPLLDQRLVANCAVKEVISLMESYFLTREDWDSIMDIGKWGSEPDVVSKIPTKVKSAFTRQYNKESHKTPFSVHKMTKKSKSKSATSEELVMNSEDDLIEDEEDSDDSDDDVSADAMIKVKIEPTVSSSGKSKAKLTKTKNEPAKGKGRGKKK